MKAIGILRVPVDEEILGLDVSHHGGKAYNDGNDEREMTGVVNWTSGVYNEQGEGPTSVDNAL
eukprot:524503-Prorocentrum_minimum.AAC.1